MTFQLPLFQGLYNSKFFDYKKFIIAHNEPIPDVGVYPQFKVMELAKDHVTVTLDGQGADEQLCGYHEFFGSYFKELLNTYRYLRLISESYAYVSKHKSVESIKYMIFYLLPNKLKNLLGSKIYGSLNRDFYNNINGISNISQNCRFFFIKSHFFRNS